MDFDGDFFLFDDDVFLNGRHLLVSAEFFAAVNLFGRRRDDLDDQDRFFAEIFVFEFALAGYQNIGIVKNFFFGADFYIFAVRFARSESCR